MKYWLAVGPPENWLFTFNHDNIWGFNDENAISWKRISAGDILIPYVTTPIKGLIGYCTVNSKVVGGKIYFPQEIKTDGLIWKLRLTLNSNKIIPEQDWHSKAIHLDNRKFGLQKSLSMLNESLAKDFIKKLDKILVQ